MLKSLLNIDLIRGAVMAKFRSPSASQRPVCDVAKPATIQESKHRPINTTGFLCFGGGGGEHEPVVN
jgi:hypothetical protein